MGCNNIKLNDYINELKLNLAFMTLGLFQHRQVAGCF